MSDKKAWLRLYHFYSMVVWGVLALPTVLWWRDSIPWLVFMSLYANWVGHFAAYQGARSEERN